MRTEGIDFKLCKGNILFYIIYLICSFKRLNF